MSTVGQRIKECRERAGLTQRALVEDAGYSYAYISRVESGHRTPSVRCLRVLAARLGVTVAYLETGRDDVEVVLPRPCAVKLHDRLEADAGFRGVTEQALYEALREALNPLNVELVT